MTVQPLSRLESVAPAKSDRVASCQRSTKRYGEAAVEEVTFALLPATPEDVYLELTGGGEVS